MLGNERLQLLARRAPTNYGMMRSIGLRGGFREYGEELVEVIGGQASPPALPPQSRRREVDDAERERETRLKDWRRGEAKAVTCLCRCCRPRPSSTSSSTASTAWTLPRSWGPARGSTATSASCSGLTQSYIPRLTRPAPTGAMDYLSRASIDAFHRIAESCVKFLVAPVIALLGIVIAPLAMMHATARPG